MPTSKPEKFTVIQTNGLAQSRIFIPTENEPISWYRRPGLKPARGAHFATIQIEANSQYAIQKTGVNNEMGHADHQEPRAAIPYSRSPDPLQKIKERSHFSPRGCHARVRGAALKNTAQKANLQCSRQGSRRTNAAAKARRAGGSAQPGRAGLPIDAIQKSDEANRPM